MHKGRLAVFVLVSLIGSVHIGVIVPLFAILSADMGISKPLAGAVAAMTPLGGLVVTLFSERVVRRCGFRNTILCGLAAQLVLLFVLAAAPHSVGVWIVVRFLQGLTLSLIFMPAQAAIGVEEERRRALYVNLLGVVFGLGLAAGPLLMNLIAYGVRTPLFVIAGLYAALLFVVPALRNTYPPARAAGSGDVSRLRLLGKVWVAMLPAVLFGLCEMTLLSIFPIEALDRGLTIAQTSLVVSLFPVMALVGQIPVSMLADRWGPRRVAYCLYAGAGAVLALPLLIYTYPVLLAVSAASGLLIGHGYYFSVSYVNAMTEKASLVKANILLEMVYNIFTIGTPPAVGFILQSGGGMTVFLPLLVAAAAVLAFHAARSKMP